MIRYYQTRFDGPWVPIADGGDVEQRAREKGAVKLTVLAVSEEVDSDNPQPDLKHRGPLYFDIDCEGDLRQAIESAKALTERLVEQGVPPDTMQIYLSGKKGLHVFVPATLFSSGAARKGLPAIYCEMAFDLAVPGMDYAVYSGLRGRTFALANAQRPDGAHRVPVTLAELQDLNEETYREWVQSPRIVTFRPPGPSEKADMLELAFDRAAKRAKKRETSEERLLEAKVEPNALTETFVNQGEMPNCVRDLIGGKRKQDANFNNTAMQLGVYIARSGAEPEPLIAAFADNTKSSAYPGAGQRRAHALSMFRYFKRRKSTAFSCAAMRSVVPGNPCEGCPIQEQREEDPSYSEGKSNFGLLESGHGYLVETEKSHRQISTFLLEPLEAVVVEEVKGGKVHQRRVSTRFQIASGSRSYLIELQESAWASKAAFLEGISGISDLAFLGNDGDLQRLKHHLLGETDDMGVVITVDKAGIHPAPHPVDPKRTAFVYVEEDFSFFGVTRARGTHILQTPAAALPRLRHYNVPQGQEETEAVEAAMQALMSINKPEVMARLLGWMTACHLKSHFMQRWQSFPLLSVWGAAGTGKTTTAALVSALHGADFLLTDTPPTAPSITKWALHDMCSSTTTVVRILDEFNEAKINRRDYHMITETLKAAWANQSVLRGTLANKGANKSSGPRTEYRQISSPLLVLSEQSVETVALVHRMISVQLTSQGRQEGEPYIEMMRDHHESLYRMARALMLQAVTTDVDWVAQAMEDAEKNVPSSMKAQARPYYSHQVIEVGLRLLRSVMTRMKMDKATEQLDEIVKGYRAWLGEVAGSTSRTMDWSEVDQVLNTMSMMSAQLEAGSTSSWLTYGVDFLVYGDHLYLDLDLGHLKYRSFAVRFGETVAIKDSRQLHKLIRDEPYWEAKNVQVPSGTTGWAGGNKLMWKLNIEEMEKKGINTMYFKGQAVA